MKNLFVHKKTAIYTVAIFIQQIIVAMSLYYLITIGKSFTEMGSIDIVSISMFVGLLVVVYIPGYVGTYFLELSKLSTYDRYVEKFKSAIKNRVDLAFDQATRSKLEIWPISEAEKNLSDVHNFIYLFLSTLLNSVLPIVTIVMAIKYEFAIAYSLCFLASFVLLKYVKKKNHNLFHIRVDDTARLKTHMKYAWPTIAVNNHVNVKDWQGRYHDLYNASVNSTRKSEMFQSLSGGAIIFISLVPVLSLILYFLLGDFPLDLKGAIVISLPRQVQMIQSFQTLISVCNEIPGIIAKMKHVESSLPSKESAKLQERISLENITINNKSFDSINDLFSFLNKKGRYTIRGKNGAGKTTLLYLLKQKFSGAHYLPPKPNELFTESELIGSTGQVVKKSINEIAVNPPSILLLDEWNANLDQGNRVELSSVINSISSKSIVIEILH